MYRVFIDTSYLIALEAADDQFHKQAQQHWRKFIQQNPMLVTTSFVFDEITTFFNSRNRHEKAVEIGQSLLLSSSVNFIHVDQPLFEAGWKVFQIHADKRYSLTDCISFEVMKTEDINDALSFDHHFEQAGFSRLPENDL